MLVSFLLGLCPIEESSWVMLFLSWKGSWRLSSWTPLFFRGGNYSTERLSDLLKDTEQIPPTPNPFGQFQVPTGKSLPLLGYFHVLS